MDNSKIFPIPVIARKPKADVAICINNGKDYSFEVVRKRTRQVDNSRVVATKKILPHPCSTGIRNDGVELAEAFWVSFPHELCKSRVSGPGLRIMKKPGCLLIDFNIADEGAAIYDQSLLGGIKIGGFVLARRDKPAKAFIKKKNVTDEIAGMSPNRGVFGNSQAYIADKSRDSHMIIARLKLDAGQVKIGIVYKIAVIASADISRKAGSFGSPKCLDVDMAG